MTGHLAGITSDPLRAARHIVHELLDRARSPNPNALRSAIERLGDANSSAFLITVARAAQDLNPVVALADLAALLDDGGWAREAASGIIGARRAGVASMGATTRAVLEAVMDHDRDLPEIVVPNMALARGLGYLQLPVHIDDLATVDVVLVSGVARRENTVWTSTSVADAAMRAAARGARRLGVVHPVAELDAVGQHRFRPHPSIVPVEV